ncbi:hypothetical protein [Puia sp.]|jgi:uncharacterized membrane protein SirB2|uniref:hypothetical protein n=1 Tax=Puia sp. TaxID=2045100 RepID=UPI002F401227
MNTETFIQVDLVLHITGFTMMAGIILAELAVNQRVNRYLLTDKARAAGILDSAAGFPRLIGIGAALLIVTGIAMLSVFKESVAGMLWFKIKMVIVLLILINGVVVLRRNSNRLQALLEKADPREDATLLLVKRRLGVALGIELLLFLIVFFLSIFRF